jgi:hypothetical protein
MGFLLRLIAKGVYGSCILYTHSQENALNRVVKNLWVGPFQPDQLVMQLLA